MYLDLLFKSDNFNEHLNEVIAELVDHVVMHCLSENRDRAIEQYKQIKNGNKLNMYVVNDLEEDAFQVSLRIQSLDMILQEYNTKHEAFDFDAVPWWDDEEELS